MREEYPGFWIVFRFAPRPGTTPEVTLVLLLLRVVCGEVSRQSLQRVLGTTAHERHPLSGSIRPRLWICGPCAVSRDALHNFTHSARAAGFRTDTKVEGTVNVIHVARCATIATARPRH